MRLPRPVAGTQYTASSFAQPLRRVFGAQPFPARETVEMPRARRHRGRRGFSVVLVDHVWRALYAARPGRLGLPERLNVLQFLTIRRYLVLMFAALVMLLAIAAVTTDGATSRASWRKAPR